MSWFRRTVCGVIWMIFSLSGISGNTDVIRMSSSVDAVFLAPVSTWYEDSLQLYSSGDILQGNLCSFRTEAGVHSPNFGNSGSAFWALFTLVLPGQSIQPLYIQLDYPLINFVDCYVYGKNGLKHEYHTGESMAFCTRPVSHGSFVFPVYGSPGDTLTCILRVANQTDRVIVPLQLFTNQGFFNDSKVHWFLSYGFSVLTFLIFILNLFFFVLHRHRVYLYYALYSITACCFMMLLDGLLPSLFTGNIPGIHDNIFIFFMSSMALLFIVFFESFFNLREHNPGITKVYHLLKALIIVVTLFVFLELPELLIPGIIITVLSLIVTALNIVVTISLIRKGQPLSVALLLAMLFLFAGVLGHEVKMLGVLPYHIITENFLRIGMTGEMIIMFYVVVRHFRLQRDKIAAQLTEQKDIIMIQNEKLVLDRIELERLRLAVNNASNGVAVFDSSGKAEYFNIAFRTSHCLQDDEQTRTLDSLYPQPSTSYLFKECVSSGQPNVFEYNTGTDLFMKVIMTPISEINPEITKMIFVETDISELNILKANLQNIKNSGEKQDIELKAMADRLEFRLRTSLSDLALVCNSIQENNPGLLNKSGLESVLEKVTDDVSEQLGDFNDMVTLITNKLAVVWEMINVDDVLSELITSFGPVTGEKVKLKTVYTTPLVIRSDKQKLVRILKLLLGNALNYSADGNVVLGCELAERANYILFTVEHSGGLPASIYRKGTIQFNAGIAEGETEFQLAKRLSDLLGGIVWTKTDSSEGTVVCLSFPLEAQQ